MKKAANLDFTDDEAGPELRNTTWKWEDSGYWFSGYITPNSFFLFPN